MLVLGLLAALLAAAVVVLGRRVRGQARRLHLLETRLEAERRRAAGLAVLEERAKIARELHDVVAHGLSLIVLQAQSALQVAPEEAQPPLRAVRRAAEEALDEMRRALDLLRDADAEPELEPQPGLGQL